MSGDAKTSLHKDLCDMIHDTYVKKNHDYGDSFSRSFEEWGTVSAAVRIEDKFNRFKNLIKNNDNMVKDESVTDTLLDMANYCIMTVMELRRENNDFGYATVDARNLYMGAIDLGEE